MNNSTERLTDTVDAPSNRWSASTTITAVQSADLEKGHWEAPPVPPIPTEHEELAWKRRSLKRCSYTSQMSGAPQHARLESKSAAFDVHYSSRPVTAFSTTSRPSLDARKRRLPEHDVHAELHWEINALNPKTWSPQRKWLHTFTASCLTFMVTLASSITTPIGRNMQDLFPSHANELAILPTSLFVLALAFGPLISRPLSASFGTKLAYGISAPFVVIFTIAAGLNTTGYGVTICRILAGLTAAPILSIGYALIIDVWRPEERNVPLAFYSTTLLLGPVMGIVIRSPITQHLGTRWLMFITSIGLASCLPLILLTRETSRARITRRKEVKFGRAPPELHLLRMILEPFAMLCTQPTELVASLYSGFCFAVLYAALVAFPEVFSDTHGFDYTSQGLALASILIGIVLGLAALKVSQKFIQEPRVTQWKDDEAAEAEQAMIAKFRASQSRHGRDKSVASVANVRPKSGQEPRRASIASSIKSLGRNRADSAPPAIDLQKNTHLAVAAANYLNDVPANRGKHIMPERIILILNNHPAFGDICAALESYHLRLDPVQLAKILVDALPAQGSVAAGSCPNTRMRSRSLNRTAVEAVPGNPASPPATPSSLMPQVASGFAIHSPTIVPPSEWRLYDALPGSVLVTSGLLLFAWTARRTVPWTVPCVAMAIFACGILMVFVSLQSFTLARHGPKRGESALAGGLMLRYLMSFALMMFISRMYDGLGVAWATMVLVIISALLGLIPWCILIVGLRRKRYA